jgi:hypothetical protein
LLRQDAWKKNSDQVKSVLKEFAEAGKS